MDPATGQPRDTWGSKLAFILAAAGSAIGLGNIWGFPTVAGQNGGAAFLLIYLVAVAFIGAPVMLAELTLGRLVDVRVGPERDRSARIARTRQLFAQQARDFFGRFRRFAFDNATGWPLGWRYHFDNLQLGACSAHLTRVQAHVACTPHGEGLAACLADTAEGLPGVRDPSAFETLLQKTRSLLQRVSMTSC